MLEIICGLEDRRSAQYLCACLSCMWALHILIGWHFAIHSIETVWVKYVICSMFFSCFWLNNSSYIKDFQKTICNYMANTIS